ncbi:MAG TPA: glycosyltransferase [Crenotrichaceae bacterium]|nr:glycosyltransferase [Crenotrichaceae bacterium]
MTSKLLTFFTLTLLVIINLSIWRYVNNPLQVQSWNKTIMGITYDPRRKGDSPKKKSFPSNRQIDQDLDLLEEIVYSIRTYSVSDGQDRIIRLAPKHNLNVAPGAWIDADLDKNRREIESLIKLSREENPKIVRTFVGNETILHKRLPTEKLIEYLREVRERTWRPVSTSETWDIWLKHPELVDEVDFIAVHILPYWEGVPISDAVGAVFERFYVVQKAYPGKQVVITEVGWPSDGQPYKKATASLENQAKFLRGFLNRASAEKITYYVIEAFDQPWKKSIEGSSGAYWGIFDANRLPKFPMEGDVFELPDWKKWAVAAAIASISLMMLFLFTRQHLKLPGKLFFGIIANLAVSFIFWTASIGAYQYQTTVSLILWGILLLLQSIAVMILLTESLEVAEVLWHRPGKRTYKPFTPDSRYIFPKVSLHLPIHNEPPDMVLQTLSGLNKLDYENLEVLVIDNNTTDPETWKSVEKECQKLGEKFRFFHLENWPGYKAGAMNYGLQQTAGDASIIAVIDSDYIVSPDWLKRMVPYFDDENIGFVQSPQDYRDLHQSLFKSCCYWEYAGFFNIGMVQRNEYNAIIQHGTMTMIRKSAFQNVGNWSEWCITEDSELGLRLFEAGYDSVYIKDSFGKGLMPDTISGYMTQRYRWVYGAMQIIKHHWRHFLPGKHSSLTKAQRYYFIAGWLPWFSDALALLFTITSIVLTALIVYDPLHSELPLYAFLLPTIGMFSFKILRGLWLYGARVDCTLAESLGAALAGLSLTHTVAKATIQGLLTKGKPFMRTPKLEKQNPVLRGLATIWQELFILTLLITAIIAMSSLEHFDNLTGELWILVLTVQAVPYFATVVTLLLSLRDNYLPSRQPGNKVNQNSLSGLSN